MTLLCHGLDCLCMPSMLTKHEALQQFVTRNDLLQAKLEMLYAKVLVAVVLKKGTSGVFSATFILNWYYSGCCTIVI